MLVAQNGQVIAPKPPLRPIPLRRSMNVALPGEIDLRIPASGSAHPRDRRDGQASRHGQI